MGRSDIKVPQLREQLQQRATQLHPHAKLPTINELCAQLQTSPATLNEALGLLERQNIIYRKNGVGIFVSPQLFQQNIAVLFESHWLLSQGTPPFWGMLWGLLDQEAQKRSQAGQEHYLFHMTRHAASAPPRSPQAYLPDDVLALVEQKRLAGVLSVSQPNELCEWLVEQGIPCVTFAGGGPCRIELDFGELLRLAVARLVEQGCRRIGLWAWTWERDPHVQGRTPFDEHLRYFLADHGLPFDPTLVKTYLDCREPPPIAPISEEQGYLIAADTFGSVEGDKPDGVVILNDLMTDGALAALLSLGIRPGEHVKIVTHGNKGSMLLLGHFPGVSVLDFDPKAIVETFFVALDNLRAGKQQPNESFKIKPEWRKNTE